MSIDIFGFRALWSPYYFAALVLITVGYFWLATKYRGKFPGSSSLSVKQNLFLNSNVPSLYGKGFPAGFIESYHVQCPYVSNGSALLGDSAIIYHCDTRLVLEIFHRFKGSETVISVFHETPRGSFTI